MSCNTWGSSIGGALTAIGAQVLDVCLAILEVLHAELGEKYNSCPLLRKMVAGGKVGRKSGECFFEYRKWTYKDREEKRKPNQSLKVLES